MKSNEVSQKHFKGPKILAILLIFVLISSILVIIFTPVHIHYNNDGEYAGRIYIHTSTYDHLGTWTTGRIGGLIWFGIAIYIFLMVLAAISIYGNDSPVPRLMKGVMFLFLFLAVGTIIGISSYENEGDLNTSSSNPALNFISALGILSLMIMITMFAMDIKIQKKIPIIENMS